MAIPAQLLSRSVSFSHAEPDSLSSSSSSDIDDSREGSPILATDAGFTHVVQGEPRTTTQGKDWRAPSHIQKKTFWEVRLVDLHDRFALSSATRALTEPPSLPLLLPYSEHGAKSFLLRL